MGNKAFFSTLRFFLFFMFFFSSPSFSQEKTFSKDQRDQKIEYFGRDGKVYDSIIEYPLETVPSTYGRLVSIERSPFNPKEWEMWFEGNNGVIRRVVLVPIKNRQPPYMIFREVLTIERD